jgi:hypothetical protein
MKLLLVQQWLTLELAVELKSEISALAGPALVDSWMTATVALAEPPLILVVRTISLLQLEEGVDRSDSHSRWPKTYGHFLDMMLCHLFSVRVICI